MHKCWLKDPTIRIDIQGVKTEVEAQLLNLKNGQNHQPQIDIPREHAPLPPHANPFDVAIVMENQNNPKYEMPVN